MCFDLTRPQVDLNLSKLGTSITLPENPRRRFAIADFNGMIP
jgi:hypothetical protein